MDTDKKNSLWSTQQRQAMAVLGLPLWQSNRNQHQASDMSPSEQAENLYCYKAEQWLLVAAEPIAVEPPTWLSDLVRTCMGSNLIRLAEVSRSVMREWPAARILNLPGTPPSAAEKQALWEHITNAQ